MQNKVQFHRVLRAAPEKVYRAFLDADAMAKWLPPSGFTGKVHHMDAKVGGTYKMSFKNFSTGRSHSFGESISSWCPTNASATRTDSTIRTCRARCTRQSP
jgi:uncharacterized protein YndB with AHSA1/START domain